MIYIVANKKQYGGHLASLQLKALCESFYQKDGEGVEVVQADGDELDYIRKRFNNIPDCNKPVVAWYGDIAKFIACNLF